MNIDQTSYALTVQNSKILSSPRPGFPQVPNSRNSDPILFLYRMQINCKIIIHHYIAYSDDTK